MGRMLPKLSEEEREELFNQAIGVYRYQKRKSVYDGNEVRRIAIKLGENTEKTRARLRKSGYELTQSASGSRKVWKKVSQSPHIYTNQED